jgi:energy-coupling factor transport system ATP-binding protein
MINKELNITVIYSTHNYNNLLDIADRLIVLDSGHIIANDTPKGALISLLDNGHKDLLNIYLRAWNHYGKDNTFPLNMSDLKDLIRSNYKKQDIKIDNSTDNTETVIDLKSIYYRYNRNSKDVIKSLNLKVNIGNVISILGGNGSGKSTLLSIIYSSRKPYKGKVKVSEITSLMPQLTELIFTKDKVSMMLSDDAKNLAPDFYERYKDAHPYDLSGGEKGLLGFLTAISSPHDILLLDEPTKGMDNMQKNILKDYILKVKEQEKTVIIVTHDIEFASYVSDKIGMMFDGSIVGEASPLDFFKDNIYYKPFISRVMKDIDNSVYLEDQIYEI